MKSATWKTLFVIAAAMAGWAGLGAVKSMAPAADSTDLCALQPPDSVMYVQPGFSSSVILKSESGFYGYGRDCPFFIQDVRVDTRSHCQQDPTTAQWLCAELRYRMGAYDLPGSASPGGTLPLTQEDCQHWHTDQRVYTKLHYDTAFTLRATASKSAKWNAGACQEIEDGAWGAFPALTQSTYGFDTYRFVVSTKLRTSYQQVAIMLSEVVN